MDQFEQLASLGAGDFEHLDGTLIEHLRGTQTILREWNAADYLQDAGLYHAAYGTAGFEQHLVSLSQRQNIAEIIGGQAEEVVYQYCACDRGQFFRSLAEQDSPIFINRFTQQSYRLSSALLNDFCELFIANELEIAYDNPTFIEEHGEGLHRIAVNMRNYLSEKAITQALDVFSGA